MRAEYDLTSFYDFILLRVPASLSSLIAFIKQDDFMALRSVPLEPLHRSLQAKLVPFAGYNMPVQYPSGIIKEHLHTREFAGLFDVSHMGQVLIQGDTAALALESLMPADLVALGHHQQTYSLLTNEQGGVIDDLIVTRWSDDQFMLVINAGCKEKDLAHLRTKLNGVSITELSEHSLLALQGPHARAVLTRLFPTVDQLAFMNGMWISFQDEPLYVTCSGYTGEDGFEISVPNHAVLAFAETLLACDEVLPVGLGARDSLRLEAGLCLYGHELSEQRTPIEAGLAWAIAKDRRVGGARAGGYLGSDIIMAQSAAGVAKRRVGLSVVGKRPVRDGAVILNSRNEAVGEVCSGGFAPSLGAPIAMAYVHAEYTGVGNRLRVDVRGSLIEVQVTAMPFVAQRYFRG